MAQAAGNLRSELLRSHYNRTGVLGLSGRRRALAAFPHSSTFDDRRTVLDVVRLFRRGAGERLAARSPGGESGTRGSETGSDAEGGGEVVVDRPSLAWRFSTDPSLAAR